MGNFKGSKAVAMATKFRQNMAKLDRFQFCIKYLEIFCVNSRVLEVGKLKYILLKFSREQKELP